MAEKLAMDSTAATVETGADATVEDRDRSRSATASGRKADVKVIGIAAGAALASVLVYSALSSSPKVETPAEKRAATLAINGALDPAPDSARANAAPGAISPVRDGAGAAAPTAGVPAIPQSGTSANGIVVPSIADGGSATRQGGASTQAANGQVAARDQERIYRLETARKRVEAVQARQAAMMHAGVMVLNNAKPANRSEPTYQTVGMQAGGEPQPQTDLGQQLKSTGIARVGARTMRDRTFLIEAGRQMPCILQNAVDSNVPGLVSCIIPENVRGANGQVVLLDKGTRVLGEYRGGMQQGQSRIFVIWTRAITPAGVSIMLGSPGADALGRAGLGGETETFFWKRFGGALLISMVGDGTSYLTSRFGGINQIGSSPNAAVGAALENDIKIKPILRAKQGQEMTIFAANDFDFSNVYSLRLKR